MTVPMPLFAALSILLLCANAHAEEHLMNIRLLLDGQTIPATLYDNASARDFASLLPLSLTLENYANERIAYLPRKLSDKNATSGSTPKAADLSYYAPWGNLAIFLEDFRYSQGLLPLGKIESGLDLLRRNGPFTLRIERVDND